MLRSIQAYLVAPSRAVRVAAVRARGVSSAHVRREREQTLHARGSAQALAGWRSLSLPRRPDCNVRTCALAGRALGERHGVRVPPFRERYGVRAQFDFARVRRGVRARSRPSSGLAEGRDSLPFHERRGVCLRSDRSYAVSRSLRAAPPRVASSVVIAPSCTCTRKLFRYHVKNVARRTSIIKIS